MTAPNNQIEATEAILRARKGEYCSEVTGWQHMKLPENAYLVRGSRGSLLICAPDASAAIAKYECPD